MPFKGGDKRLRDVVDVDRLETRLAVPGNRASTPFVFSPTGLGRFSYASLSAGPALEKGFIGEFSAIFCAFSRAWSPGPTDDELRSGVPQVAQSALEGTRSDTKNGL